MSLELGKNENPKVTETGNAVSTAFDGLLGLLRVPVPVAAAVSVAIMLGSTTVKIQSFDIPRLLAAITAMVLLIIVYVGCYKAILNVLRHLQQLALFSESGLAEAERQAATIRRHTSILNPFSSTQLNLLSKGSPFDYIGLFALLLPMGVVFGTSLWALSDLRTETTELLQKLEHTEAKIEATELLPDESDRKLIAIASLEKEFDDLTEIILLGMLFFLARTAFEMIFAYFLIRIGEVALLVNGDAVKRLWRLGICFVLVVLPSEIVYISWLIQLFRFTAKALY